MSETETGGSPTPGEKGRRRWVRRAVWAGAILLLYSLTGFFLVPPALRWAIQRKGSEALHRRVTLSEVSFNPFSLRARLHGLRVLDRDGQPLAAVGGIDLRLGLSGIFRRAWRLRELTIDRPSLHVRFLRDGKLSFTDMLSTGGGGSSTPRLIVDRLAIRGGSLEMSDESVTPRFVTTFAPLNAEVRDLITIPGERGEHQLSIGFAKHSSIRIAGRQTLEPLGLSGRIEIKGIELVPLAQRLAEGAPIQLRGGEADASLDYDLRKEASGVQLRVSHGALTAAGLSLARAGTEDELLSVPSVEVRDVTVAYPARQANIGSIRIIEPRAAIAFDSQGQFNWAGKTSSPEKGAQPAAAVPWKVSAGKVGIENGTLHFDDRRSSAPVAFDLTAVTIGLDAVTSVTSAPIAFTAAAASGASRIGLRGTIVPSPFTLDSQIALASLDLTPLRPWASVPGLTLNSGLLGFDGRLSMNSRQPYLIEGDGELKNLVFVNSSNSPLLACKTATVRRARFDGANSRFQIRNLDLDAMYANVVIDKQRNLNLSSIGTSSVPASVAVASSPGAAAAKLRSRKDRSTSVRSGSSTERSTIATTAWRCHSTRPSARPAER